MSSLVLKYIKQPNRIMLFSIYLILLIHRSWHHPYNTSYTTCWYTIISTKQPIQCINLINTQFTTCLKPSQPLTLHHKSVKHTRKHPHPTTTRSKAGGFKPKIYMATTISNEISKATDIHEAIDIKSGLTPNNHSFL